MIRFLFPILVVLILGFPVPPKADPLNSIHIKESDKGIAIRVDDAPLGEVLKSIEGETGIQFHVSPSIINDRMTVNLNAPDWQTAMRLLLEPYGQAELWNPRLDMTEIHILSRADDSAGPPPQKQRKLSASETGTGSPPMLKRKQLLKLVKGSFRAPLSQELFDDPEIRAFLNQNGIHSLEDMKDIKKTRRVRIKVRKMMMQLKTN